MSGILDLLNSDLGKQIISGVSGQTGQSQDKTAGVLSMALPVLMGAMKRNASTPEGASGLMGALSGKHSGGILDNLGGFFGGGVDKSDMDDGQGILGHLLGGKQDNVQNAIGQKTGMDSGSVAQILKIAAPILMGFIGKQSQSTGSDSSGIGNLLGGLLGGQQKEQSLIESLIDGDGDGSILDDLAGMALGSGNKSSGGIGGLLGGLFGK